MPRLLKLIAWKLGFRQVHPYYVEGMSWPPLPSLPPMPPPLPPRWCQHVGGLGPPFPFCETCRLEAE